MPDREKVIKAIDICLGHGKCDDCGYRIKGGYSTMDCRKPMMRDALELLKEQEAVYPSWQNGKMYCGHCGAKFPTRVGMRFCHRCGVPIKLKVNDDLSEERYEREKDFGCYV